MNKLTMDQFLKNWPLTDKPRAIQLEAAEKTIASFNAGCQYVVVEIPVGGGKSAFAFALAQSMGDSHFLTLTEQLQHQYLRDFQKMGMEALKGRSKYSCDRAGQGYTCADGKLMFEGKDKCKGDVCPYLMARERALASRHTVSNYHSFLFNVGLAAKKQKKKKGQKGNVTFNGQDHEPSEFAPREYTRAMTVIDECHAMEPFLLDAAGVDINLRKLSFPVSPLPIEKDEKTIDNKRYVEYAKDLYDRTQKYLETTAKRGILDPRTKDELESLSGKLARVLLDSDEDWIAERERTKDGRGFTPDRFSLRPLQVSRYGRWLTGFGERLLLMSGTVLSPHQLVTSIGLDPTAGDFHTFDSPFPVENRPIYVDRLDMSYDKRDESWPKMVQTVKALLDHHNKEKGLLLAPSNKLLKYVIDALPDTAQKRRILLATGEDRMKKYHEHIASSAPTVLAASGFWEGADLKGDSSRFQIIPQLPRPMWQGQVKARASSLGGGEWYRWLTYVKALQGLGRSIRTETDEAVTYILDGDFRNELARKEKSLIPLWVQSSVYVKSADGTQWEKWLKGVPDPDPNNGEEVPDPDPNNGEEVKDYSELTS